MEFGLYVAKRQFTPHLPMVKNAGKLIREGSTKEKGSSPKAKQFVSST